MDGLAERVGFEPTIRFPVYTLSKRAPSTARPSLQLGKNRIESPAQTVVYHPGGESHGIVVEASGYETLSTSVRALGPDFIAVAKAHERAHEPTESLEAGMTAIVAQADHPAQSFGDAMFFRRGDGADATPGANGSHVKSFFGHYDPLGGKMEGPVRLFPEKPVTKTQRKFWT